MDLLLVATIALDALFLEVFYLAIKIVLFFRYFSFERALFFGRFCLGNRFGRRDSFFNAWLDLVLEHFHESRRHFLRLARIGLICPVGVGELLGLGATSGELVELGRYFLTDLLGRLVFRFGKVFQRRVERAGIALVIVDLRAEILTAGQFFVDDVSVLVIHYGVECLLIFYEISVVIYGRLACLVVDFRSGKHFFAIGVRAKALFG